MSISENLSQPQPEAAIAAADQLPEQLTTPFEQLKRLSEGVAATAALALTTVVALYAFESTALTKNERSGKGKGKLSRSELEGLSANLQDRVNSGDMTLEEAKAQQRQAGEQYLDHLNDPENGSE